MKQGEQYKVSVIIAAYNMESDLMHCIKSIENQNLDGVEIVLVNDGSTDNTEKVIRRYAANHPNVVPVLLKKNGGVSNARNTGAKMAHGKYLHFVDADDIIPPKAYKVLWRIAEHDHPDVITGNYIFKSKSEKRIVSYVSDTGLGRCLENNNLSHWNRWLLRSFILENHIEMKTDMKTAEDAMFILEILQKEPSISYTNAPVYQYNFADNDDDDRRKRDKSLQSVFNSFRVLRENFSHTFPEESKDLWVTACFNYMNYVYFHIYEGILSPDARAKAFAELKELLFYIYQNNEDCNFGAPNLQTRFVGIFQCDFLTLCALDYSQYMLLTSLRKTTYRLSAPQKTWEQFIVDCRSGMIGMRTILQSIKAWFDFKFAKLFRR